MLLVWLPRDARGALDRLRRPGLSALERALAVSVLDEALKKRMAGGPMSPIWIALLTAKIQQAVADVVEPNDVATSDLDE